MPPLRTSASRAGKAERTHEENVERAFIAASRRCDRTLEARVESARRASEIHKARTGRGLKITEKDVQNEEMYEEEDDLPLPYRHLTAGFQTSSPEFNRRFAAYLTTHVAIRTALEQSIIQSYAQQQQAGYGVHSPQFLNQQYGIFPSPMIAHQAQQSQQLMSPGQTSTGSRYSPYPMFHPINPTTTSLHQERSVPTPLLSTAISPESIPLSVQPNNPQTISMPSAISRLPTETFTAPSLTHTPSYMTGNVAQHTQPRKNADSQNQFPASDFVDLTSLGPMSTSLPAEARDLIGPSMGLSNTTFNMAEADLKLNLYGTNNDSLPPSSEQLDLEMSPIPSSLDPCLLPEALNHNISPINSNPSYINESLGAPCAVSTPSPCGEMDPSDWRYFLNDCL